MFEKGLSKKEDKKFKKLLENSVVFFDVNNLKNQQKKKNQGKTLAKKDNLKSKNSVLDLKINEKSIKIKNDLNVENKSKPLFNDQVINFIPEDISTIPPQRKRLFFLVMSIAIVLFVNAILYISLLKYKISLNENINKILASNEKINKEYILEKSSLEQYKNTKEKIDIVEGLLKSHIYWTSVINVLKENKIDNVNIKNFSGSTSGMIYISMESTSYKDIADQINKFKTIEDVKGITINNASSSNSGYGVNFDIGIEFDPRVFLNKE